MTKLLIYLVSAGLIVLGSMGFIAALGISGRIRMLMACLAACVPAAVGIWLFHSSGLKVRDFGPLLQSTTDEVQQVFSNLKESQSMRREMNKLLGQ